MKLKKLNIISFGGLKNLELTLENGLNCIYGDNEQGKSTVMAFIKMMFYGSDRGSAQISKNIRKKYTPWDGSAMAGSIEFEFKNKPYRLEREFRSSNSTDKVSLTDLALGEKQTAEPDIGARLFGISAAAFERSIFIGQLGFPDGDTAAEGELNARLTNMVSTGDERLSLEDVSARLEKARFSIISKSGRAGEYYKNQLEAKQLEEKLSHSITANKQYSEGKERLLSHSEITAELNEKMDILKEKLSAEQDVKNAEKLKSLLETKEKLETVKKELALKDATPADESFLRGLKFSLGKAQNAAAKVTAKEKENELIKTQLNSLIEAPKLALDESPEKIGEELISLERDLQALRRETKETEQNLSAKNHKSAFNPLLLVLGIIFAALTPIAYFAVGNLFALISLISGAVLISLSLILKPKEKTDSLQEILNNQAEEIEKITAQINEKKAKLEAIRLANSSNSGVIEAMRSQLDLLQSELAVLKNDETLSRQELNKYLCQLNIEGDSAEEILNSLEEAVNRQKELKQQINFLLRDLNNISYDEAREKLAKIESRIPDSELDFEKLRLEYERLHSQINERREKEIAFATELKAMLNTAESPDVLKAKLDEIISVLTSQKEFCDSLDIALEVLKESFAELRSSFGSELEKKSSKIFSNLTNGKYGNMTISKSFAINVEEAQAPISREAEYLSSGTFDQAYLSLRLAIADLICENEPLPIFLDDALAQYDDKRTENALKFLNEYAADSQSIMFTCHKSVADTCKALNCNLLNLI